MGQSTSLFGFWTETGHWGMAPDDTPGKGDLAYRIELIRNDMNHAFEAMRREHRDTLQDMRIQFANFVQAAVYKVESEALKSRVASLEGNQRWLVRSILGVVIVAVLAFVGISGVKIH